MNGMFRRRTYLVHKSSQLSYVAFSVLPAVVMTLFCMSFIFTKGEMVLKDSNEKPMVAIYELQQSMAGLEMDHCSAELQVEVQAMKGDLLSLTNCLEAGYEDTIHRWSASKRILYLVLLGVLMCVGLWAFIFSHRIAGPLYRIQKNIDEMARGEEIPPVKLRKNDEFQELGASLEALRLKIKEMEHVNS
jgi:hypothetical protein